MPRQRFICDNCAQTFLRYPSQVRGLSTYCSYRCKAEGQSETFLGEDNPNWRGVSKGKTCECGNTKDPRANKCYRCVDRSYAIDNLTSENDFERLFSISTTGRRQNQALIRAIRKNKLFPYSCALCSVDDEWNGEKITLQLDHINGNRQDNRLENIRFLCPNCHSQTKTWGHKNRKVK